MAVELKAGTVVSWRNLSPILSTFNLMPEAGSSFPDYKPGQYIALRRDDCKLSRRVIGDDGRPRFVPDLDESGQQKQGPVTHSYSIASPPFVTREKGHLEFYVVLESGADGQPGRLTGSLFGSDPPSGNRMTYVSRIVGDFTLDKRAPDFGNVVMVGTGTGLATFASMIRQKDFEAASQPDGVRYTLIHANRTFAELAFHEELQAIEAKRRLDFVYLPSVSRPTPRDLEDPRLGQGRGNNVLRLILGLPCREQELLEEARAVGGDTASAEAALAKAVPAALPRGVTPDGVRSRFDPAQTVVLTCGNPAVMADIQKTAEVLRIRFEKEDW